MPALIQILWRMLVFPLPPQDCSATCLFVIREKDGMVILGMLGDGLLAAIKSDGGVDLLSANKDESFSNFTASLSTANPTGDWKIIRSPKSAYRGFLLCTDGIADDLLPDSVEAFVKASMSHYRNCSKEALADDLQRWLDDWPVPGHSDDKTIACLYQTEETDE